MSAKEKVDFAIMSLQVATCFWTVMPLFLIGATFAFLFEGVYQRRRGGAR